MVISPWNTALELDSPQDFGEELCSVEQTFPRQMQPLCDRSIWVLIRPDRVFHACWAFLVAHVRLQGAAFGTLINVCRLQRTHEPQCKDNLHSK